MTLRGSGVTQAPRPIGVAAWVGEPCDPDSLFGALGEPYGFQTCCWPHMRNHSEADIRIAAVLRRLDKRGVLLYRFKCVRRSRALDHRDYVRLRRLSHQYHARTGAPIEYSHDPQIPVRRC